ncbi:hypothetical protein [Sphingomonas sp. KR3-1]|uniref:Fur family transcriptional regulator n=1 Tax=Sphingomonas sp. KR3-1 TaxID=3156611 RepID=UPI0032B5AAE6
MAERAPRADRLPDIVLAILRQRAEPLTGVQLTELLRAEGQAAPLSAVFRAIRRLVDRGLARKIWIARAYVAVSAAAIIALHCRRCGALCEVEGTGVHEALDRLAAVRGFRAATAIVEVPGLCWRCRGR